MLNFANLSMMIAQGNILKTNLDIITFKIRDNLLDSKLQVQNNKI